MLVGIIDRLEFLFHFFIAKVYITVKLVGQLAKGLLDDLLFGVRWNI